jgi:hypothetical protein
MMIDRVNELYEEIFGYPKYKDWISFNESLPTDDSPYGVVPIDSKFSKIVKASPLDIEALKGKQTLKYLAKRQKSDLPFLPIWGTSELRLFHSSMGKAIEEEQPMKDSNSFYMMTEQWNQSELSVSNSIFPKLPIQLSRHYKRWVKNQSVKDAEITSGAAILNGGLDYTPGVDTNHASSSVFETLPLSLGCNNEEENPVQEQQSSEPTVSDNTVEGEVELVQEVVAEVINHVVNTNATPLKSNRLCRVKLNGQKCPSPETCDGRWVRSNCKLHTGGDARLKKKRKSPAFKARLKCSICNSPDCTKGISKKTRCPKFQKPDHF